MNLFFIHICILSYINQIWAKSLNGDIDDFINKLLNSNKFDELAEKIAEKAARKIFDLDNIRISHNIKTKNEVVPKRIKHKTLRERDGNENLQVKKENLTTTTEKSELKEIKEKSTNQNTKLNEKQATDQDITSSKEQLRLKFKNLKASRGEIQKEQNILKTNDVHNKIGPTEPITKIRKSKQRKNRFEKVNNQPRIPNKSKNFSKSDMSSEKMKESTEDNDEEMENKSKENRKSTADKHSEEKDKSISIETLTKRVDNKESDENEHTASVDTNERNESKKKSLSVENGDSGTESKEKRMSNEDFIPKEEKHDDRYETEKESNEEKPKDIRKSYSVTTKRLIIRREGDKLFAFENSPDYQEYEEKVARQGIQTKEILLF